MRYQMVPSHDRPKFTVVFPLYDDRGQAAKAVKTWLAQRTSERQFELVIVAAGHATLPDKIRRLLGPIDRIVQCTQNNEATMYNAGALKARAPWILFTESHVLPADDCVATLERKLAANDFDAATLGSAHIVRSRFSEVDAKLYFAELSAIRELGLWRSFGLRGMIVRRQVLETVGWFNEQYYRFCETALAIRLDYESYRLVELPDVVVAHVDSDNVLELAQAMYLGRKGSCRFWAHEPELAAKYFGHSMEDHCGAWISPTTIRETIVSAWRMWKHGHARGAYAIAKPCLSHLSVAVLGWKAHSLRAMTLLIGHYLKFHTLLMFWHSNSSARFTKSVVGQYQKMREGLARLGAIDYYREAESIDAIHPESACTQFDAIDLLRMSVGLYPPELWYGSQYCWSRPAASVKLPLNSGTFEMCIDIRPTGQLSVRRPRFFVDGKAISANHVCENAGLLAIRFDCHDNPTLAWTCDAFEPRKSGLPDRRKLGFALLGAKVNRVTSIQNCSGRAA